MYSTPHNPKDDQDSVFIRTVFIRTVHALMLYSASAIYSVPADGCYCGFLDYPIWHKCVGNASLLSVPPVLSRECPSGLLSRQRKTHCPPSNSCRHSPLLMTGPCGPQADQVSGALTLPGVLSTFGGSLSDKKLRRIDLSLSPSLTFSLSAAL